MYNSFPNSVSSAAKWIVFAFFGVILMAILFGANLKDAKWLNPNIANAEAERIQVEAAHQQATYEIQERLTAAQTEAEIQQIQREQKLLDAQYQHDIQVLNQDLAHQDLAFRTRMTVLTILASAFALMLFIGTIIWVGSRAWVYMQSNSRKENSMAKNIPPVEKWIPNLPEREPYEPWNELEYRRQQIAAARNQERKEREEIRTIVARMKGLSNAEQVSKSEYYSLPFAGD
ncbi:MAG: hypothetical protein C4583_00485 [Anaerolineaceae bacterium]|nr:MAG: hypothetical protein C4583_00485 [Anaerolineaceae bacterium]